jgi:YebC/PmpR family DNA-binding regulatory protein
MAGHSRWAQIKHAKSAEDKRRGVRFSKLLAAITAAAGQDPSAEFNPRLRSAIEAAKAEGVSNENINRAISRAVSQKGEGGEEFLFEVYGPGGVGVLVRGATHNRNRTVAELKHLVSEYGAKWAEEGGVRWAFREARGKGGKTWQPNYTQHVSGETLQSLRALLAALRAHPDVEEVVSAAATQE